MRQGAADQAILKAAGEDNLYRVSANRISTPAEEPTTMSGLPSPFMSPTATASAYLWIWQWPWSLKPRLPSPRRIVTELLA